MPNPSEIDQLDQQIEALLAADHAPAVTGPVVGELLAVAEMLRALPDPDFKSRLKAELLSRATPGIDGEAPALPVQPPVFTVFPRTGDREILPTLFASGAGVYPVHRGSFMASALAHTAAFALLVTVGVFARPAAEQPKVSATVQTDISPYLLPVAPDHAGGGSGGGTHERLPASQGNPPRFAREQITPPAIVVGREKPALAVEPTVIGPPAMSFPQTSQMGDPLSEILGPASNGPGDKGGIGTGHDGGVGGGEGPGVGPGGWGGIGGGPYVVGRGVSAPRAIFDPEPEYSDEARRAKYQGIVVLRVVVGSDGRPRDIKVARTLGMGLDERAIEAVGRWRFEPAYKDGQPVAVMVDIEVSFRLY